MPASRPFKYYSKADLTEAVKQLGQELNSGAGQTTALRNSSTGFLVEKSEIKRSEVALSYLNARTEIWIRGQGLYGTTADAELEALEPIDPRLEKTMKICTVHV